MEQIRILIYKKKSLYDDLIILPHSVRQRSINCEKQLDAHQSDCCNNARVKANYCCVKLRRQGIDALVVSMYIYRLQHSESYRKSAYLLLQRLVQFSDKSKTFENSVILIRLQKSRYNFLDYAWNERITRMVWERQEIDHAMSWLSTLGGAFSALGDQFDRCAKVAGKISVEQFKLSMRLGDPQLVARCRLYAALSLLQQGHYKASQTMVEEIYKFGVRDKDIRLQRMCQGVWAKLKYCYSLRKKKKKCLEKPFLRGYSGRALL